MTERTNPITPAGFAALRAEYERLFAVERPAVVEIVSWAAGNGDRSENGDYIYGKKRLREIDRELGWLSKRIKAARVVNPALQPDKSVILFGATVTLADEEDNHRVITLVGDDEADAAHGRRLAAVVAAPPDAEAHDLARCAIRHTAAAIGEAGHTCRCAEASRDAAPAKRLSRQGDLTARARTPAPPRLLINGADAPIKPRNCHLPAPRSAPKGRLSRRRGSCTDVSKVQGPGSAARALRADRRIMGVGRPIRAGLG